MVAKASDLETVFVRVISAPRYAPDQAVAERIVSQAVGPTPYLALVYSQLPIDVQSFSQAGNLVPTAWAGDPLIGAEPFEVNWVRYTDYASRYFEGEKDAEMMKVTLFQALSPNLSKILSGEVGGGRRTRTWFHSDAPEVNQLPWELVAYANGFRAGTEGSFVRGIPPESPTPLVPVVDGRLRLGVIDPSGATSTAMRQVLSFAQIGMEVVPLSGDCRAALRQAVEQGVEVLHIIVSASVTTSYDGVLEFPGSSAPPVTSAELTSHLRGSRVRLIGLTPPAEDPSALMQGPYLKASAYRAFAYFATSPYPIPTFVAPVGPMDDAQVLGFWTTFYQELGRSLEIEVSMAAALRHRIVPVGLFLRQLQTATFKPVAEQPAIDPSAIEADLTSSAALLKQYEELGAQLGVKSKQFSKVVSTEHARQERLHENVSQWIEGVHEE